MKVFQFTVFLLILLATSCDQFKKKKISSEEILKEEMQTFNWKDVDEYPTFVACDSLSGNENKRQCFEISLKNSINKHLSHQTIIIDHDINDRINLTIEIDKNGKLSITNIAMKPETKTQIPELDSLLRHSFDSLPKILPAIKRSQQVTTQFILPIDIKIN